MATEENVSLLRILVCDDDPADRKLVRTFLQRMNDREIVFLEAGNTEEIQSILGKHRIDLVLMDIQMPGKSGLQWLEEIVANGIAPVVMLTGSGDEEVAVRSIQDGAVGYLPKSRLSSNKLTETIDSALTKWRNVQQSKANQEELERLVNHDSLTGLYNRRSIFRLLDEQISYSNRYKEGFSISILDIDHFKKVNDMYGHLVGDDVLGRIAGLLSEQIRGTDFAGRYGGEEFILVLPRADLSSSMITAERIRTSIESSEMQDSEGNTFHITISQGIAAYKLDEDRDTLIARADEALYKAKNNGRNRVETSD